MGLAALVRSSAASAFAAIGDIPEVVTYRRRTATTYNTTTGGVANTTSDTASVEMVLTDPTKDDQAKPAATGLKEPRSESYDRKGILLQTSIAFRPEQEDLVVLSSGPIYQVVQVGEDPAHATWTLKLKLKP